MPKQTDPPDMRILIHDFGGYAFPFQLSDALSRRGFEVVHMYCASHQTTPPGIFQEKGTSQLTITPVSLNEPLNKYNFVKRWRQENAYGHLAAGLLKDLAPDVVISANTPLDAQAKLIRTCRQLGIPFVFWLQDLISVAAEQILKKKIPILGGIVGKYYVRLEQSLLKKSSAVIAITDSFTSKLETWSIDPAKISVLPNWAPVDWLPALPKQNDWAQTHHFADSFCFMYTGTLGMKHNPSLLLQLAQSFNGHENVNIIVVSQGLGATWLSEQKKAQNLDNLHILPYQPADILPQVLATSDVLIALLDDRASAFSVPSKVLTYLCAQRPLLLAMPADNQAAQLVQSAKAGYIVPPTNAEQFSTYAHRLYENPDQRANFATNARTYAESAFSIETITDQFIEVINRV